MAAAYLLPWIIAASRKHHQVAPIAVINIFLGWTVIGWIVALAMSVSHLGGVEDVRAANPELPAGSTSPSSTANDDSEPRGDIPKLIEQLSELHAVGVLTDEEFAAKKAELLGRL